MRLSPFAAAAVFVALLPRAALAIEGGGADRTTTHAVAIATGGPASPTLHCSGVLVSPNVVLTARHCISRLPAGVTPCAASFGEPTLAPKDLFVSARPDMEPGPHWVPVASWDLPEPASVCGNDVAVLVLTSSIDARVATPARPVLDRNEFEVVINARRFGMAGFGATSPAGKGTGERRSRFDIPLRCVPVIPGFPCDGALEYIDPTELTGGAGPCHGDSGGGAVADADRSVVFGVLSRGATNDDSCSEGIFERTDVWRWLIARTVVRATPPDASPPPWARAALPASPKIGEMCMGAGACGSDAECASLDGRRSFVCVRRCDQGCGPLERCEAGVCIPGDPPAERAGCEVVEGRSAGWSSGIVAIQIAALLGLGLRRRRGHGHDG